MVEPSYTTHVESPGGAFEVSLEEAGPISVVVSAAGFIEGVLPQVTLASTQEAAERWEIVLVPAGVIRGSVRDESGRPIAGAQVEMLVYYVQMVAPEGIEEDSAAQAAYEAKVEAHNPNSRSRTDANGRFELTGLPQGPYQLAASHPDYFPASTEVIVRPGRVLEGVEMVLSKTGATVMVIARDAAGGGVAGRTVRLTGTLHAGLTDASGRWQVTDLPPGRYQLVLEPQVGSPPSAVVRSADIALRRGETRTVVFEIDEGISVTGRVDRAGAPVPDVKVIVSQTRPSEPLQDDAATHVLTQAAEPTDAQGRFAFEGLAPGDYQLIILDGADEYRTMFELAASDRQRNFQVHLGSAVLSGTIRDSRTGQPIADAETSVFLMEPIEDVQEADDVFFLSTHLASSTDAAGRYRLEGLARGRYLLEVEAAEYGHVREPFTLTGSAAQHDMTMWPSGHLVVTVVDPDGVPVRHAQLLLSSLADTDNRVVAMTDAVGMFHFSNLAPGSYEIIVATGNVAPEPLPGGYVFRHIVEIAPSQVERLTVPLPLSVSP